MATTKAAAKPAQKRATAKPKAVVKKRELKEKNYRLLKYQPLTFTLKVGRENNLLVWDEATESNRAIRYCPNEKSIFVDQQSETAVVEPIIFLKGLLSTKPTDVILQEFLEAHPKRGQVFDLIDEASDAEELMDLEEIKIDIKQAIRAKAKEDTGTEELRIVVSVLTSDVAGAAKMTIPELKTALYNLVEENVFRFVDEQGEVTVFDDVEIKRQAISQHAFNSAIIQLSADASKVMWSDNKAVICLVPVGRDHVEFFADYLGTEEGLQVAVEISKRR